MYELIWNRFMGNYLCDLSITEWLLARIRIAVVQLTNAEAISQLQERLE
jgi:hypothetical protein